MFVVLWCTLLDCYSNQKSFQKLYFTRIRGMEREYYTQNKKEKDRKTKYGLCTGTTSSSQVLEACRKLVQFFLRLPEFCFRFLILLLPLITFLFCPLQLPFKVFRLDVDLP